MKRVIFFCAKVVLLLIAVYILIVEVGFEVIIPYAKKCLQYEAGEWRRQEFITICVGGLTALALIPMAIKYVGKIVFGVKPQLHEGNMTLCLCNVEEISEIPIFICTSYQEEKKGRKNQLKGEMLQVFKGKLSLILRGADVNQISEIVVRKIKITMTNSNYTYTYREGQFAKNEDIIKKRKLPKCYTSNCADLILDVEAYLYFPRLNYSKKYLLEHTWNWFEKSEDEMKVKMHITWINKAGCPRHACYTKRLKQTKDINDELYWRSTVDSLVEDSNLLGGTKSEQTY